MKAPIRILFLEIMTDEYQTFNLLDNWHIENNDHHHYYDLLYCSPEDKQGSS